MCCGSQQQTSERDGRLVEEGVKGGRPVNRALLAGSGTERPDKAHVAYVPYAAWATEPRAARAQPLCTLPPVTMLLFFSPPGCARAQLRQRLPQRRAVHLRQAQQQAIVARRKRPQRTDWK